MGGSIIKSIGALYFNLFTLGFTLLLDFYVFTGVKSLLKNKRKGFQKVVFIAFWVINILSYVITTLIRQKYSQFTGLFPYSFLLAIFFLWFMVKFVFVLWLIFNDLQAFLRYSVRSIYGFFTRKNKVIEVENSFEKPQLEEKIGLSRSQFLLKTGTLIAATPALAMSYGIISGAHDYRVRREKIYLQNLPNSFNGFKIAQISDIHAGSFWNKTAVFGGVEMLMKEKPDIIMFTGDLVNNTAAEMINYLTVFDKLKADFGVYSVLGNHDYGNYVSWNSEQAYQKNHSDLLRVHKNLGWNLLLNEHQIITQGNDSIAIIGVENWSAHKRRFPTLGDVKKAKTGADDAAVKILMSHDPTHWQAEILPLYPDIDLTLSGHTHGMQFGIETANFKWSPVKYLYKEWAGLYQSGKQYLYVNRGYGYLGYPGRFGILPEITILTLENSKV